MRDHRSRVARHKNSGRRKMDGRDMFGRNMRGRKTRSEAVFGMMANSGLFHRASFCQTFFCHEHVYASQHRNPRDLLLATHRSLKSAPNLRLYSLWQKHLWQKYEGQKNAVGGDVRDDGKQRLVSSSIFLPSIFLPSKCFCLATSRSARPVVGDTPLTQISHEPLALQSVAET